MRKSNLGIKTKPHSFLLNYPHMIYFAHRGASAYLPHNTLPAFTLARQLGATHYELDVHLTRDGALAVYHDYTLPNSTAPLGTFTADQLQKTVIGQSPQGPAYIPLLEEVLPIITPHLECLNIELKNDGNRYPGIEEAVLSCLHRHAPKLRSKVLFSSFDYDTLLRLRALDKGLRLGLLTRTVEPAQARAIAAESLHMSHTRLNAALIASAHANGLLVHSYTVNDVPAAQQLAQWGADGIFTDRIDLFVKP